MVEKLDNIEISKIAVLRANAIGDFILSLPAFEALRSRFPRAEIILLGQQWHADFLADRPGPVDRVIVVPGYIGLNSEPAGEDIDILEEFFTQMQLEQFDLAIQLYGGGKYSNPYLLRLGAKQTAGLKTPDAVPLDRWIPYVYFQSEVLRYLEVVGLVGAQPVRLDPHLELTDEDIVEAQSVLQDLDRPLVVMHVGAGDPRRRWPAEKFAALGDRLSQEGYCVAIVGTEIENEETRLVIRQMTSPILDFCDHLSLGGLAGLASRCQLFISNDSGPLHVAAAVGASTVGIFWCGNLVTSAEPYRRHFRPVSSWRLHCPICGRDTIYDPCGHRVSFVADITVEEVLEAAHILLENL